MKLSRLSERDNKDLKIIKNNISPFSPFIKVKVTYADICRKCQGRLNRTDYGNYEVIDFRDRFNRFCKRVNIEMVKEYVGTKGKWNRYYLV